MEQGTRRLRARDGQVPASYRMRRHDLARLRPRNGMRSCLRSPIMLGGKDCGPVRIASRVHDHATPEPGLRCSLCSNRDRTDESGQANRSCTPSSSDAVIARWTGSGIAYGAFGPVLRIMRFLCTRDRDARGRGRSRQAPSRAPRGPRFRTEQPATRASRPPGKARLLQQDRREQRRR